MSQHATLGATALERKDYAAAVRHYTAALADFPSSPDYHMKRAMAHQRSTPPQPALALLDAERAVHFAHQRGKREALAAAQLRRAIALLALRRYGDAQQCLAWARDRNEKEPGLGMWEAKVEAALRKLRDADAAAGSSGDAAAAAAAAAAGASGGAEGEAGGEARQQAEGGTAGDAWMTEVTVVEIPEMDEINQRAKESKAATSAKANTQAAADAPSAPAQVEVPKGVQTPAHKIRHDWYQTADTVVLTLLVKGVPKDEASIEIRERSVSISFPMPSGSTFDFSLDPLFAAVEPAASRSAIMGTKVELALKKARPGQKWPSLEGVEEVEEEPQQQARDADAAGSEQSKTADDSKRGGSHATTTTATTGTKAPKAAKAASGGMPPAYPTSSRTGPKDWDKLATELTKKGKKATPDKPAKEKKKGKERDTTNTTTDEDMEEKDNDDDDEDEGTKDDGAADAYYDDDDMGGDPVNAFFKKLYANADPDTRRAMVKSYQESGGTALSTDWADVGKRRVEVTPPDGMEARPWDD